MLVDPKVGDWVVLNQDFTYRLRKGHIAEIISVSDTLCYFKFLGSAFPTGVYSYRLDPTELTDLEKILYS